MFSNFHLPAITNTDVHLLCSEMPPLDKLSYKNSTVNTSFILHIFKSFLIHHVWRLFTSYLNSYLKVTILNCRSWLLFIIYPNNAPSFVLVKDSIVKIKLTTLLSQKRFDHSTISDNKYQDVFFFNYCRQSPNNLHASIQNGLTTWLCCGLIIA